MPFVYLRNFHCSQIIRTLISLLEWEWIWQRMQNV